MLTVHVIGYPSSAAAYCVGVEEAPRALRAAGLADALRSRGHELVDHGDLTTRRWRPDHTSPLAQNLDDEVAGLVELRDVAAAVLRDRVAGDRIVVLGGSCTVALGTCAVALMAGIEPRLVYIDRHLDLNVPSSMLEGSLSRMGMAHALGVDGAAGALAELVGRAPLLPTPSLSCLGVDPRRETTGLRARPARAPAAARDRSGRMVADQARATDQAHQALGDDSSLVYLDVDVLGLQHAPLARERQRPKQRTRPVSAEGQLLQALDRPGLLGPSLGQLVPATSVPPGVLDRFVEAVVTPAVSPPAAV